MNARSALEFSPGLVPAVRDWRHAALCTQVDPDLFFPESSGAPAEDAKRVCRNCEVRRECLEFALATAQRHGVWGGFSERQLLRHRMSGASARRIIAADEEKVRRRAEARAARNERRLAREREHRSRLKEAA